MILDLDGMALRSEQAFHEAVRTASGADYYGGNLDALDELLADQPPPIVISWSNAARSRTVMGKRFGAILNVIFDAIAERGSDVIRFRLES